MCKQLNPDFQAEELCSITKDSQEIAKLLSEMQEYMPKQEAYLGKLSAFSSQLSLRRIAHEIFINFSDFVFHLL